MSILTAVQYIFILFTLSNEWTLLFDQWILTTTIPFLPARLLSPKQRYLSTAFTSCLYAILEPISYFLLTNVTDHALFSVIISSWEYFVAVFVALIFMSNCWAKIKKSHDEHCLGKPPIEEESNENIEEKTTGDIEEAPITPPPPPPPSPPIPEDDQSYRFCPNHTITLRYRLAPALPLAFNALANASMLYYTQWLHTLDSQAWFQRSNFCFAMPVLLVLTTVGISKSASWKIAEELSLPSRRSRESAEKFGVPIAWEVTVLGRVGNLLIVLGVRAAVRVLCGLDPFIYWDSSSRGLSSTIQLGDICSNPEPTEQRSHMVDRWLAAFQAMLPTWWLTAYVVLMSLYHGQWMVRDILQRRRAKKRAATQDLALEK